MQDRTQKSERYVDVFKKALPILSFIVPLIILYSLDPMVFEKTWKGRIFDIFFLWLVSMELILGWEKIQSRLAGVFSARTIAFVLALLLPTIYVIATNFYGLNTAIVSFSIANNIPQPWAGAMPLSVEYLVFAMLFILIVLLEYGTKGLGKFLISTVFLGIIGMIYMIDNIYPNGRFTPFQMIVPTTAALAASVLGAMGYPAYLNGVASDGGSRLMVRVAGGNWAQFNVSWPCSGVESLLIYAVTILLFLKDSAFSWKQRARYFILGAVVTYLINVLRVVTIVVIAFNNGQDAAMAFHDYYGQLYSITWIVSYPLLIIGSRMLWAKIREWRTARPVVQV
jgi:exosortase/archaeosortase family protein